MTLEKNSRGYVPALDGLRGMAVILVMCCHFFFDVSMFKPGWIGVDLFFVLSGYLITSMFTRYKFSIRLVAVFFRNRMLRILPLYFVFLLFFLGAWYFLPPSRSALFFIPSNSSFWLDHFLLLQNWIYVFSTREIYTPLVHLWSVAVEEQYYIFFPLVVYVISKVRSKIIFIAIAILAVVFMRSFEFYHQGISDRGYYYYNTLFRSDSFLMGVLLAFLLKDHKENRYLSRIFRILGVTSLMTYIFFGIYGGSFLTENPLIMTFGYTVIAVMFMSLIYFTVGQKTPILDKLFTNRFLVFSGKISYGLYVFHFPFDFFNYSLLHSYFRFLLTWGNERIISIFFTCAMIGMVYLVSYISFAYFESCFLRMKKTYAGSENRL